MYFSSVMLGGWALSRSGSQQPNSLLSPWETIFIKAIHPRSLQLPQLWAFATATRDSHEVPSTAVAAQMSWNTFKMEAVSWAEVVCGQLCSLIHFSQIQHVFSVCEPLLHLHYFRTWQETNHCTTLGHTVGGSNIHLMSSQCQCKYPVLLIHHIVTGIGPGHRGIL